MGINMTRIETLQSDLLLSSYVKNSLETATTKLQFLEKTIQDHKWVSPTADIWGKTVEIMRVSQCWYRNVLANIINFPKIETWAM